MVQEEEDDQAERLINEGKPPSLTSFQQAALTMNPEYKTWKKNSPFLYDMILGYVPPPSQLLKLPCSQLPARP